MQWKLENAQGHWEESSWRLRRRPCIGEAGIWSDLRGSVGAPVRSQAKFRRRRRLFLRSLPEGRRKSIGTARSGLDERNAVFTNISAQISYLRRDRALLIRYDKESSLNNGGVERRGLHRAEGAMNRLAPHAGTTAFHERFVLLGPVHGGVDGRCGGWSTFDSGLQVVW